MAKREKSSQDGSWKVEVEAFHTGLGVYTAFGVKTRVFEKRKPDWWQKLMGKRESWAPVNADTVSANGVLGVSQYPGVTGPIPGSPALASNSSEVECRAWQIGIGIRVVPFDPKPGPGPGMIVDLVTGYGSASRGGEIVTVGPVTQH